jgi:putative FmdB family regulatory protein
MPTYEYRCRDCGHCVELLQTLKEMHEVRSRLRCQKCEGKMSWQFPCPAIVSDKRFLANRDDGFGSDDVARKRAYAKARRNGTDISGKFWSPELNSWVGSKAEVIAKAAARGCGVAGSVNAPAPEPAPPPEKKRYEVAEDMVQAAVEDVVEDHGGDVTPKERAQLVESTRGRLRGRQFDA